MKLEGRTIVKGEAKGEALVTHDNISFMGTINPNTGIVIEKGHELEGECLKDKILVFPQSKGSTGGSYMLYDVVKNGYGPAGIINVMAESIVVIGAIVAELPMIDQIDINKINTGDQVYLNAGEGFAEVENKTD